MAEELFIQRSRIMRPAADVFAWHERPGAFERLCPPWERIEVRSRHGGIRYGARAEIRSRVGPLWTNWCVEHRDCIQGERFRDVQLKGPFASWEHTHAVEPVAADACELVDTIRYRLPGGAVGDSIAGAWVRSKLARTFRWRHAVTRADLEREKRGGAAQRILIAGSSGLLGQALVPFLRTRGHTVVRLVRRAATAADEVTWNPARGEVPPAALEGVDALINLAGENVAGGRWTPARRERIMRSRVDATRTLATALGRATRNPAVLINASAIGFYGDQGDRMLTEADLPGRGFLAGVVQAWERAAEPAADAGARVACLRFGVVLSPAGGALGKMAPIFRLGLGGPIGAGRQWLSWIAVDDAVDAIDHVLHDSRCTGPLNLVAPEPVTNAAFAASLAGVLRRPALLRAPVWAVRAGFGAMGEETVLGSTRALPEALVHAGYGFRFPRLENALRHVLGSEA